MKDGKKYILVADDEKEIRDVLTLLLSGEGYAVVCAEDGQAALSMANWEIDLYILDVNMPRLSGFMAGVEILRDGNYGEQVELRGNNELTELAEAVNYLSESEQKLKEKEKRLYEEREELIRTLSHDIRTPLTSIMSYTELLGQKERLTVEEQQEYRCLVAKKTEQIKNLTDILLDGGHREPEFFEDARLLFEQLADEFEAELEDDFTPVTELSYVGAFSGNFDVGELRRIFDNLISNVKKYAEPSEPVELTISKKDEGIVIRQSNRIAKDKQPSESYKMGLYSIRRIAQNYGGTVEVRDENGKYEIIITLSNI